MEVEEKKQVAAAEEMRNVLKNIIWRPLWTRTVERTKDTRKDYIKVDL